MARNFMEMLKAKWDEGKFACVGLDSELKKIPQAVKKSTTYWKIVTFNQAIVDATKDLVCAYKPNIAFYEACEGLGLYILQKTISYIHKVAPNVPVILDAKRGDIGNTNAGYVEMAFDFLRADAITVHPYLGAEALQPFLEQKDKGIIVLCRTSNPGAGEFQDRMVSVDGWKLYELVAHYVARNWNKNGNCGLVVGATYPDELRKVRELVGDMPILIPGIGAQGGDVEATVKAGMNSEKQGMIINSSRDIIFASNGPDFAEAAGKETRKLHDMINQFRI